MSRAAISAKSNHDSQYGLMNPVHAKPKAVSTVCEMVGSGMMMQPVRLVPQSRENCAGPFSGRSLGSGM